MNQNINLVTNYAVSTQDTQIKFDISHELFETIVYDKSNDTLLITYK